MPSTHWFDLFFFYLQISKLHELCADMPHIIWFDLIFSRIMLNAKIAHLGLILIFFFSQIRKLCELRADFSYSSFLFLSLCSSLSGGAASLGSTNIAMYGAKPSTFYEHKDCWRIYHTWTLYSVSWAHTIPTVINQQKKKIFLRGWAFYLIEEKN